MSRDAKIHSPETVPDERPGNDDAPDQEGGGCGAKIGLIGETPPAAP